ncbi:MarR family winged helix-turn-helix transcriptional regulator [Labedaea rhizosphaerae]|uniref:DNA-binding MarR family transcriptional regulator n=1 Tax=Labedaea rhizosphaerae TaxID=598644 RepID=A0A4V3CZH3_LABRH|nr:MarR family transcriptional regulator [Labedaea rhizosphaerae]TDP98048.1 DNA-binding MarR family transcriptional regulator [Labedaea rhizosphaerae]
MGDTPAVSTDPSKTAADLKLAIGRIARALRQRHAVGDLTMSEVSVLSRLDREGATTPGVLADQERVRPQAMASTLAALTEKGLVRRRPDAQDGRKVLMSLTAAGTKVLTSRRDESVRHVAAVLAGFTQAEQRKFAAMVPLLERLADAL